MSCAKHLGYDGFCVDCINQRERDRADSQAKADVIKGDRRNPWPQVTPTPSDSGVSSSHGTSSLTDLARQINALHLTAATTCLTLLDNSQRNTGIGTIQQDHAVVTASFARLQRVMDHLTSAVIIVETHLSILKKLNVEITGEPTNKP